VYRASDSLEDQKDCDFGDSTRRYSRSAEKLISDRSAKANELPRHVQTSFGSAPENAVQGSGDLAEADYKPMEATPQFPG
jgi:hypothetical protein